MGIQSRDSRQETSTKMYKVIIALFCVAVAATHGVDEQKLPPQPFSYSYDDVSPSGLITHKEESQNADGIVVGYYDYDLPDGSTYRTDYYADHSNGFLAQNKVYKTSVYRSVNFLAPEFVPHLLLDPITGERL